ncbi:MAG: hypothetical protein ACRC8M_08625 [Cetobacterium sp.]
MIGLFFIGLTLKGEIKSIYLETNLTLIGNGVVITPDESGTTSGKIYLEHGTKKVVSNSEASQIAYIKSTVGALPEGILVRVGLDADKINKNDLSVNGIGTSQAVKMAHTLTGTIENGLVKKNILSISGNTLNDNIEVTTTKDILKVNLISAISEEEMTGKTAGIYKNVSHLSVVVLAK